MVNENLNVRLDAITRITKDYLSKIHKLLKEIDAEDIGGVMSPISKFGEQKVIANLMRHPFCFGGPNFKN